MSSISVIHSVRDGPLGDKIAKALLLDGHSVRRAHQGAPLPVITKTSPAIVIWSPATSSEPEVLERAGAALEQDALIPVTVGGQEPPLGFERVQPVDLSGWGGDVGDPRWRFVVEEIDLAAQRDLLKDCDIWPDEEDAPTGVAANAAAAPVNGAGTPVSELVIGDAIFADVASSETAAAPLGDDDVMQGELFADIERVAPPRNPALENSDIVTGAFTLRQIFFGGAALLAATTFGAVVIGPFLLGGPQSAPIETTPASVVAEAPLLKEAPMIAMAQPLGIPDTNIDGRAHTDASAAMHDTAQLEPLAPDIIGEGDIDMDPVVDFEPGDDALFGEIEPIAEINPATDNMESDLPAEQLDALVAAVAMESEQDVEFETNADPEVAETTFLGNYLRDCLECPDMAALPAGEFLMGAPEDEKARHPSETPVRTVSVPAFAIATREITFKQWDACVADGGCNGHRPSDEGWGRGDLPVINVSFQDAQNYAAWLSRKTGRNYRLPSEAEWEYAARAGTQTAFSFGPGVTASRANFNAEYVYNGPPGPNRDRPLPVASFAPSAFGLFDMHGNVWEWTADCWTPNHEGAPSDASVRLGDCSERVLKGGAFNAGGWRLRAAHRIAKQAGARARDNGFRIVRDLP